MIRSDAEEHLKKSTVKIDTPYGVGSGFFIDKNLIATCHHVVKDCSASELEIVWRGSIYQATSIESNPDDDLALVSVKIDKKHPCVQIDKSIETGDACFSFGFPKAYRELGDTLTFVSEGHNEKFLKFKNGQFESGFSGAPILNYRTLKVCAVVKRTRDEYSDLGGRGIPISKLFDFEGLDIDDNGSIFSKEMFKNWVWTSSVESVDRLQFSVLALVETLVAVGVSFFIWFKYGWILHILIGLVSAPLFLLRTKKSEKLAFSIFDNNQNKIKVFFPFIVIISFIIPFGMFLSSLNYSSLDLGLNIKSIVLIFMLIVYFYFFLIVLSIPALIIKFFLPLLFSLILSFISFVSILKTFSYDNLIIIPQNWFKNILVIDSFSKLELLVVSEKTSNILVFKNVKELIKKFFDDMGKKTLLITFAIFLLYIPTIIFRYSLKSTAWIYFPLIWLIEPQDKSDLNVRMKQYSQNFIAYMMFLYSLIIIFVFTLLPLLFPPFITIYTQNLPKELETIFFAYSSNFSHWYGIWYITRFLSALITIVFMFSFTKILNKRENHPTYGDKIGAKILSLKVIRDGCIYITLGFTAYHILTLLPDSFFGELWANVKVLPEE